MKITLVTGGARAGKSTWAEQEARRLGGESVTYVATAEPLDGEMAKRIARHRAARPSEWHTEEVPRRVPEAVTSASTPVVLLDCVTLWISNLVLDDRVGVEGARERVEELLRRAAAREGHLVVVTNEVGLGVIPGNALARRYRDLLGWANRRLAEEAREVVLLVAGLPLHLKDPSA